MLNSQLYRSLHCIRIIPLVPLTITRRIGTLRKLSSFRDSQAQVKGTKIPEISCWTKKQTTSWLSSVQLLEEDDQQIWNALQMDGKSLLLVTVEMLEKRGMAFGAAMGIVYEIQKLLGQNQTDPITSPVKAPRLKNLDAKTLLDCILNSDLQKHFKADPAIPCTISQNNANFPRIGRQETFRETFTAMTKRKNLRAQNKATAYDRLSNPMPATIATTGAGKSRFLDELAAKLPDDLELCKDTTMRGYLENSVAVTVTFNGGFKRTVDDFQGTPGLGLAIRVLFSYFVGPSNMNFSEFEDALKIHLGPLFFCLTLETAVECIVLHSGKGVLLLVDELMKSENPMDVVRANCLNQFDSSQFNVVITTLNGIAFNNETTLRGREIIWLLLAPASLLNATSLFADAKHSFPLRLCIADCGGHFRTLESLALLWCKVKSYKPPLTYAELNRRLGASLTSCSISLPLVKAALLGLPVESTAQCPGTNYTYGDHLAMGNFLNTPAGSTDSGIVTDTPTRFIPRVSPLQLFMFAEAYKDAKSTKEYPYANTISAMLELKPNFSNGIEYQKFHAHWETLVRILHNGDTEPWTIKQLYKGELSAGSTCPSFYISAKSGLYYPWLTHFPQSLSLKGELPTFPPNALTKVIMQVIQNHPGFDIVSFEHKRADGIEAEPVIICTECRFSGPTSTKRLSKAEVAKKRQLTVKQFRPYFDKGTIYATIVSAKCNTEISGLTLKEDNLFLIVCAFRQVGKNVMKNLPANTMVLNRDMLKTLYSPSLASRPQFILPLNEGELTQPEEDYISEENDYATEERGA